MVMTILPIFLLTFYSDARRFFHIETGKCLDAEESVKEKRNVTLTTCNVTNPYQQWDWVPSPYFHAGWFPNGTIQSKATKLCMAGYLGGITSFLIMEPCENRPRQRWEPSGWNTKNGGKKDLVFNSYIQKCLGVHSGKYANTVDCSRDIETNLKWRE